MLQVNVFEAKTDFSKLIKLVESRSEDYVTVARNGKPVVKIVPFNDISASKRIGVAKGEFDIIGDFDEDNAAIADILSGGNL